MRVREACVLLATATFAAGCSTAPIDCDTRAGAIVGTLAGTYTAAELTLTQGAGGGSSTATPFIIAGAIVGGVVGAATGHWLGGGKGASGGEGPARTGPFELENPRVGQFDLMVENISGFTGPGSIVRVREFNREGTGLHFPQLGSNTEQIPTFEARYWFDNLDAVDAQFRYFDVRGTHFQSAPFFFNGSQVARPQNIDTNPTSWFSLGAWYERRLTPLYANREEGLPEFLKRWDVRAKAGFVYTYIDFELNSGHARVTKHSKGEETKEDFNHQAMPVPMIGFEAIRPFSDSFLFELSGEGGWLNRWNSLRDEGGAVWASQNQAEAHARILYSSPQSLGPIKPMVGMFAYHYSQLEDSHEDGNFIRWFSYGPEFGITASF